MPTEPVTSATRIKQRVLEELSAMVRLSWSDVTVAVYLGAIRGFSCINDALKLDRVYWITPLDNYHNKDCPGS
jgi:hypothetical protein